MLQRRSLAHLQNLPTIRAGQTDDLKIETAARRVWLSRLTTADGMPYNHQVTVEILRQTANGARWETIEEYEAR